MSPGLTSSLGSSDTHQQTNGQTVDNNAGTEEYVTRTAELHQPRKVRLVCIGAGISGIAAAYKYQFQLQGNVDFTVYEKNHDVGGTWLENRYPGCACDIPAHGYTYSWEGNPEWSRFYAEAPEIFDYFKGCAVRWNCLKYIKLLHRVVGATWSEEHSGWKIKVENLSTGDIFDDFADVILSATGILNHWKWPEIKGINSFEGKMLHSARWDQEYDYRGKTVAVIGAGSSAIQIVPSLQPVVKKLVSFIRSPTWITPEFSESLADAGRETKFSQAQIDRFKTEKDYFLEYRRLVQNTGSDAFPLFYKGTCKQKEAYEAFTNLMRKRLNFNERLCEKLIPTFEVGCRRFTPGNGFLEALVEPNAEVITEDIECITPKGLKTIDGVEHEVDVIVCATGFDTTWQPAFPVVGRHGRSLSEFWKDQPIHYLSIAAPGFPNYFITGGPNSPIANGSLIAAVETAVDYAYACIKKMQTEDILAMDPTEEAVAEFLEHRDAAMKNFVWSGSCKSWYKNGMVDGPVIGPWVGTTFHFNEALSTPRFEDFKLKYRSRNRFAYLGHGRTRKELYGGDPCDYMREPGSKEPPEFLAKDVA